MIHSEQSTRLQSMKRYVYGNHDQKNIINSKKMKEQFWSRQLFL